MKYKTTRKSVVNGGGNIRSAGYCALQCLLRNHEPVAYTAGIYGWNFDVYQVYGLTICTGYRNMPGERCEGVKEYETKAAAIRNNIQLDYTTRWNQIETLLKQFCAANGGDPC